MSISIQTMLEAGVHFGHQTKFWNPKMKPYIFGSRSKIHIINLDKTVVLFDEALKFVKQVVKNKGTVLFVGTRSQASEVISSEAIRAGMPYVDYRWLGGMLTNFETVKKSIKKLEIKKELLNKSGDNGLSKKELLDLSRDIQKLQSSIGGIAEMKSLPSALFIIDTGCHDIAIKEAKKLGIPVIGVVDTNNDPSEVDYIIPGNDDSIKAITLYTSSIADAILKAKESSVSDLVQQVKVEMVEDNQNTKQKSVRRIKTTTNEEETQEIKEVPSEEIALDTSVVKKEDAEKLSTKSDKPKKTTAKATVDRKESATPKAVKKTETVKKSTETTGGK